MPPLFHDFLSVLYPSFLPVTLFGLCFPLFYFTSIPWPLWNSALVCISITEVLLYLFSQITFNLVEIRLLKLHYVHACLLYFIIFLLFFIPLSSFLSFFVYVFLYFILLIYHGNCK